MNPPKKTSLEDVISKMGQIKNQLNIQISYKPVSQDIHSALVLK